MRVKSLRSGRVWEEKVRGILLQQKQSQSPGRLPPWYSSLPLSSLLKVNPEECSWRAFSLVMMFQVPPQHNYLQSPHSSRMIGGEWSGGQGPFCCRRNTFQEDSCSGRMSYPLQIADWQEGVEFLMTRFPLGYLMAHPWVGCQGASTLPASFSLGERTEDCGILYNT